MLQDHGCLISAMLRGTGRGRALSATPRAEPESPAEGQVARISYPSRGADGWSRQPGLDGFPAVNGGPEKDRVSQGGQDDRPLGKIAQTYMIKRYFGDAGSRLSATLFAQ